MSGNTFGQIFKVTSFGESHGKALGCIVDGLPSGLNIDESFIQNEMAKRKPGTSSSAVTSRKEDDFVEILSGVFEGKSTGTPIAMLIKNSNQHSKDYENIKDKFRPGHADFTYFEKYGIRDYRGGGRSSGRETCARVAAGALAKLFLAQKGIKITAYTKRAAGISVQKIALEEIEKNSLRCPDIKTSQKIEEKIKEFALQGNSCGGIVECLVQGVKAGLGEPVFDKLDAELAKAILSIGAIKGIEFGEGFAVADLTGSQNNDPMAQDFKFTQNNAGGILGGISNGNDIIFRAAVKPVPSIYQNQKTVDINGNACDILIEGRHDVCLCPRIVPVVEAMTAITLTDMYLRNLSSKL